MELKELLRWVVSGGGSGIIAYFILPKFKWFTALSAEHKRYAAIVLTFVLADLFFLAQTFAGYDVMPVGVLGWIEQLCLVGTTAFGLSQIIHASRDLRLK